MGSTGAPCQGIIEAYGLHEACFDQGCFGAPGVYETRLITSSWFLFEALHELRVDEGEKEFLRALQDYCPEGCGLSQCGWTGSLSSGGAGHVD